MANTIKHKTQTAIGDLGITGCGVYAILHQETGKGYVGSSLNLAKRWREHRRKMIAGIHESPKLRAACVRDGIAAFRFVVLDRCSPDEVLALEAEWIAAFNSTEDGYNVLPGPFGDGFRGWHHRPETRAKMVEAHKRSGLADRNRQRVWTADMRQRISDSVKRSLADPEVRAKRLAACRTPEAKRRTTQMNLSRTFSLGKWARDSGHLARLAEWHRGRKRSLKTRERMSEANRRAAALVSPEIKRARSVAAGRASRRLWNGKTYDDIYGPERAALERGKRTRGQRRRHRTLRAS